MPESRFIEVVDARENNLDHVSLRILKNQLVVFAGVSGSGKSSLVFDTIAVEAMRQLGETFPLYIRNRMPRYEAPRAESVDHLTTAIVVDQRPFTGDLRSTVGTMTDIAPMLRLLFSRCGGPSAGTSGAYSFNDPAGMCPRCSGLGRIVRFDFDKVLDREKSLNQGAILFPGHGVGTYQWMLYANSGFLDPDKPLKDYSEKEWQDFLHGSGAIVNIVSPKGKVWDSYNLTYEGLQDRIERLFLKRDLNAQNKTNQKIIKEYTHEQRCPDCGGARLNPRALASRLAGANIFEMGELEMGELATLLEGVGHPLGRSTAQKISGMLRAIEDMGLGYLHLNRSSRSLSGGEAQRLKLMRHLGGSLVGLTYIFDEPSVGLHPKDVSRLNRLLLKLRDRGNTVLVVEHDKEVIGIADEVIEMGPGAGRQGGRVVYQGPVGRLLKGDTPTAKTLLRRSPVKTAPRPAKGQLLIQNASRHNLQNLTVSIPKGVLTVVSGLAGSGKSSLVCGELPRQHPEVVHISQAPIGTTPRSTPATYVGIMDEIRRLFAKENGVAASLFSYNSKGACPVCEGKGEIKTEMAFMDPVTVCCEACGGARYSNEALAHRLRGASILEVLEMTVDEAAGFFAQAPKIHHKLKTLQEVGMGYITLGQPTTILSGGECQRIKLASHLRAKDSVYVMDEPTSGLHGADVELLLGLLEALVDGGNTVVVVEHNLEVVKRADHVIDLGPGGGKSGGRILFEGSPAGLLECGASATAEYLRQEV